MKPFRLDDHPVAFLRPRLSFPFAWAGHIPFAYLLIDLLRPRSLVELGTDSGNSYLAFCQAIRHLGAETHCTAIDSWEGDAHARKYADDVYLGLKAYHDPLYGSFSYLKRAFFEDAVADFADGSIDLLHIDGLHSYEAVRNDFETWLPKLSDRAVVLFHDTQVRDRGFGVYRLIEELAGHYPTFDFAHSNGLGVVQVGAHAPEEFKAFMQAAQAEPERMRECFSQLGQTIVHADGGAPTRVEVTTPDLVCSLFYRQRDGHFSEERLLSAKLDVTTGKRAIEFLLPSGVRPDFIRLDPGEAPGVFRLGAIRLAIEGDASHEVAMPDIHARLGFLHCDVCPAEVASELRIVSLERDPYVEIEIGDLVADLPSAGALTLRLELTIEVVLNEPAAWELTATQAKALGEIRQAAAGQIALRTVGRSVERLDHAQRHMAQTLDERIMQGEAELQRRLSAIDQHLTAVVGPLRQGLAALQKRTNDIDQHVIVAVEPLLQGLARQEAVLRSLLQRRSLLSRLRLRLSRTEFRLMPLQHLGALDPADRRWQVTGNDPMFACGSDNFPLAPGWYMVSLDMQQHDGSPVQAVLYPDYGPGVPSDMQGINLSFVKPGQSSHRGLVCFTHPLHGLRFDPATSPCQLSVRRLIIKRVSKLRAGLALLQATRISTSQPGGKGISPRMVLNKFRSVGFRGMWKALYASYTRPVGIANTYDAWLENYDSVTPQAVEQARSLSAAWEFQPLVSVLVPVYNTEEKWLRRCIESVQAQAYPHWELCLADDASPASHVTRILNEYAAKDGRIRVVRRPQNGHISATSNSALALATGEYVALLDHDDELHPLALFEVVKALQSHRSWKLVYSDEDKIDQDGRRYDPYMKPDWNYDLLLSQNCISHLGIYQRQLMLDVGGFREGYEGSQDWDLALRCIERLTPADIGHIPRVLYHWRAIPGSTAVAVDEKSYARTAGMKAIAEHLERVNANAEVKEIDGRPGNFRVSYALPAPSPKISLIIPTRDGLHLLQRCIDSILTLTTYDNYEIIIVDNQSSDPATLQYLRDVVADPRVSVLAYDKPFNYSALNNYAVRQTRGELVGLVNNDIEAISPDWLQEMAGHAMRPEIGAVGAMLYYPNDTIQHAGVVLGVHGVAAHAYCGKPRGYPGQMGRARLVQNMSAVTAACLLIRRAVFDEVNGLDESLQVAFNDIDFCLRVQQRGYRNLWTPFAELYHHESATRGYEDSPEKKARFASEVESMQQKWPRELSADPVYSLNLTLIGTPFELAFPPRLKHIRGDQIL
ncbi:glycosyltransferase [Rhodanobacter sp. Root480]|uniref:glycosyltransferase family 2 protein n=1 Tax=Rhodanobacter sp. Root480 TaxID=1736542 RepID=UPI000A57BA6A|nr:glycosyltransferase [Rhodanobacter sp. Root480]